jgi:hypothetical protein
LISLAQARVQKWSFFGCWTFAPLT